MSAPTRAPGAPSTKRASRKREGSTDTRPSTRAVELTRSDRFTQRIVRLVLVSLIALGVITLLAARDDATTWVLAMMAVGWVLMPTLLYWSIRTPKLRYGLLLPGTVFPIGVLGMALATTGVHALAWWLIALGLALGGTQGMWFWYRWMPVPRALNDPFGWPRLALVGVHVALILAGIATLLVLD